MLQTVLRSGSDAVAQHPIQLLRLPRHLRQQRPRWEPEARRFPRAIPRIPRAVQSETSGPSSFSTPRSSTASDRRNAGCGRARNSVRRISSNKHTVNIRETGHACPATSPRSPAHPPHQHRLIRPSREIHRHRAGDRLGPDFPPLPHKPHQPERRQRLQRPRHIRLGAPRHGDQRRDARRTPPRQHPEATPATRATTPPAAAQRAMARHAAPRARPLAFPRAVQ